MFLCNLNERTLLTSATYKSIELSQVGLLHPMLLSLEKSFEPMKGQELKTPTVNHVRPHVAMAEVASDKTENYTPLCFFALFIKRKTE